MEGHSYQGKLVRALGWGLSKSSHVLAATVGQPRFPPPQANVPPLGSGASGPLYPPSWP